MKRKKFLKRLSLFVALVLVLNVFALPASALTSGEWEYSVISENEKTAELTGYTGSSANVEIPDSVDGYTVTKLSSFLFYGNTDITDVTVPNGVEAIGSMCFNNCTSLVKVTIPKSVTSLPSSCFSGCTSLQKVSVAALNTTYSSISGVLYDFKCSTLMVYPLGKTDTSFTVPKTVKTISGDAFSGCTFLQSVTVGDNVETIGARAFYGCTSLESVTLPDGLKTIGGKAFYGCTSLSEITLPSGLDSLGNSAFSNCTSLTAITVPDSLTSISDYLFSGCTALTDITLPTTLTKIGESAFYNTGWYNSQALGVLYLGNYLICYKEKELSTSTSTESEQSSGTVTDGDDSESCLNAASASDYVTFNVTVTDGTTLIADNAFYYIDDLYSIKLPDSMLYIGDNAFTSCTTLLRVSGGAGIVSIGGSAFSGCTLLTEITLPSTLTEIGDAAFANCVFIKSLTVPSGVTSIGYRTFYGCKRLQSLSLSQGLVEIGNGAFTNCEKLTSISIPDTVESIRDYAFDGTGWYSAQEDGVLYIGDCLIGVKGDYTDTSLGVADGTRLIADYAFFRETSLENISLPETVNYIGKYAFYGTGWYKAQPDGQVILDGYLIDDKNNSESGDVTVGENVRVVAAGAFDDNKNIQSVTLSQNVLYINEGVFDSCTSLTEVNICSSDCIISAQSGTFPDGITLGGLEGSTVQEYAEQLGITFKTIIGKISSIYLLGDLNGDGEVDSADRKLILSAISGKVKIIGSAKKAADLNHDGSIDTNDLEVLIVVIANTRGDINEDGEIDLIDYNLLTGSIMGSTVLSSAQFVLADADKDNAVDGFDIFRIDKMINGYA